MTFCSWAPTYVHPSCHRKGAAYSILHGWKHWSNMPSWFAFCLSLSSVKREPHWFPITRPEIKRRRFLVLLFPFQNTQLTCTWSWKPNLQALFGFFSSFLIKTMLSSSWDHVELNRIPYSIIQDHVSPWSKSSYSILGSRARARLESRNLTRNYEKFLEPSENKNSFVLL